MSTSDPRASSILLYLCTDPNTPPFTSIRDKRDTKITPVALNNAVYQYSTSFRGGDDSVGLLIAGKLNSGNVANTVDVRVEGLNLDEENDTADSGSTPLWLWHGLQSTRQSNGTSAALHNITGADLISPTDNTKRQDTLLSVNIPRFSRKLRVAVQWKQAAVAGDWLIVAARHVSLPNR